MKAILKILGALIFGLFGLSPAVLTYWYLQPSPVVYSSRVILTPAVPPGGELRIRSEATLIQTKCMANVFRSIVDSTGREMPFVEEGVHTPATNRTIKLTVPLGAAPGFARYRVRVEWACNPVQEIFPNVVLQPELFFQILPVAGQQQLPEQQGTYQLPFRKSELAKVVQ